MVLTASVGVFIERVAYKPLRLKGANRLYLVITALMMGIVLEYGNLSLMGTSRLSFPTLMPRVLFEFGGATITLTKLVAIGASFLVFALLQWIVTRTKLGMAMRAVSYDKFAVPLMGIPLDVVIIFTFSLGSGMAGLAGLLYSMNFPVLDPFMGALVGWKAFVAAVVGGIGDIRGAFIGGFIMAFLEVAVVVSSDFIPFIKPEMRDLVSFSILLIILTIKPTGLFGRPQTTKI
jgi:branched-chain amino acid transport system permease protein